MPKRLISSAARIADSATSSAVGVEGHVGVGEEGGAALRDQQAERREITDVLPLADDLADVAQVLLVTAFETADQRVGFATLQRQRADDGGIGADDGAGGFRDDAAATDQREIEIDIFTEARIVFRVDDVEIRQRADAQSVALQAGLDDLRTADQDRLGDAFLEQHLRGAQHALVFAFGEDHALAFGILRRGEDRLHDEAGAEDKAVQLVEIGVEIGDRADATPLSAAALATAGAMRRIRRGSNGEGIR
jgi:hypothetical protein